MNISEQVDFESSPALVRQAITGYVESKYPQALGFIKWDSTGTRASASKMGASCSLVLSGAGPTVVDIKGKVGFPASLAVSEAQVMQYLRQAIQDLKKKTP
jgi:hypothetical protein